MHVVHAYPAQQSLQFTLHNYDSASAFAAQAKAFLAQAEPVDLSGIPEEYHEFTDVTGEWNHRQLGKCERSLVEDHA